MRREAELLKITNQSNVGPKLVDFSKNFLVMEYLEGEKIGDWIASLKKKGSSSHLKITIKKNSGRLLQARRDWFGSWRIKSHSKNM